MTTVERSLQHNDIVLVAAVVGVSVLVGYAYGIGNSDVIVGLLGLSLFGLLVWDPRIVVPIVVVAGPFGPKFPMSFGNLYLTTAIVLIALAAWIWRNPLQVRPFMIQRNRLTDSIVLFLAIMFISSLQNLAFLLSNTLHLLRFVQFFFYTGFFIVVLSMSFTREQIKAILILVLLTGVTQGLVGVWQWLSSPGVYISGTFDYRHSNYAVYIVFITLLLLGVLLESRSRTKSVVSMIGIGALLYAVIFSFSRGAYVSLAAAIAVVFVMPHGRRRKLLLLAAVAVGIALLLAALPTGVLQRTQTITGSLTGREIALSFGARLQMWGKTLADFKHHPILGRGTWSYGLRDNFYMKALGETGIIGLGAFLWLLLTMLRAEWRAARARIDDDLVRGVAFGLLPATVACVAVFNLSGDLFTLHRFMGTFWIVLALVLRYVGAQGGHGYVEER